METSIKDVILHVEANSISSSSSSSSDSPSSEISSASSSTSFATLGSFWIGELAGL